MSRFAPLFAATALGASLFATACIDAKDDAKGVVDDSLPPAIPADLGKADTGSHTLAQSLESPHPYGNNLDRVFRLDLAALPSCASSVRLHFSVLRTEAGYDFVEVGEESFDGSRDNTWTDWVDASAGFVNVRLTTDGSVTRHGFAIDRVEWNGFNESCPIYPLQPCPEGRIPLRAPVEVCGCAPPPSCVGLGNTTIRHSTSRGRMHGGKQTVSTTASTLGVGPTDGILVTEVGTVDAGRLTEVIVQAANSGVLFDAGYDRPPSIDQIREDFTITAGSWTATFVAPQGGHSPAVTAAIDAFEALFSCAGDGAPLTCDAGSSCVDNACLQDDHGCNCAEIYQPVCGLDGRTHGNQCSADCAGVGVAHAGECGQVGDSCGGLLGGTCVDPNRCRYDVSTFTAPYPDAAGACVGRTYCDAPVDCLGLPAPAVLGNWACDANTCAFRAGPQWREHVEGRFETAHPYANGTSVWKAVTLPAEAQALRLALVGTFKLEANYDFLEVWTWQNGAWQRVRRYTGTVGPALTDTFAGRYHYLRFVSDSSVVANGFSLRTEWR